MDKAPWVMERRESSGDRTDTPDGYGCNHSSSWRDSTASVAHHGAPLMLQTSRREHMKTWRYEQLERDSASAWEELLSTRSTHKAASEPADSQGLLAHDGSIRAELAPQTQRKQRPATADIDALLQEDKRT